MSMSISCARLRARVRRRARPVRAAAVAARRRAARATCACSRGRPLPPPRARAARRRRRRRDAAASSSRATGFSPYFVAHFVTPLVAAVWSTAPDRAGDYPARYLFSFLQTTACSGHRLADLVHRRRRLGALRRAGGQGPVGRRDLDAGARRSTGWPDGVEIRDDADAVEHFDGVVIATHPHQALAMLAEPTPPSARCSARSATPSTRPCCTPTPRCCRARRARRRPGTTRCPPATRRRPRVQVSYNMNRLQRLDEIGRRTYVVTLNGDDRDRPGTVHRPDGLRAPGLHHRSVARATACRELNDGVVAFAGAYHGWGFHEDGARSGVDCGARAWASTGDVRRLYDVDIAHVRADPVRHEVRHRSYQWFVDLDDLPRLPRGLRWLARFEARDHLGDPARSLARQRRRLPRRARHRPARRPDHDARQRPQLRLRVQPAVAVLVPRRGRRAGLRRRRGAQHLRRSGTATCCTPTTPAGPRPRSSSTSRRSTRSTATTG